MATDRELLKNAQVGMVGSVGLSNAITAVAAAHKRMYTFQILNPQAAATNTAESGGCVIENKAKLTAGYFTVEANTAADASDGFHIKIWKRTGAGASQTLVAGWNTITGQQGATTRWNAHAFNMPTNSDIVVSAGSVITYEIVKIGSGKVCNNVAVTLVAEEV